MCFRTDTFVCALNVAVTEVLAAIVTPHVPVPVHPPDQPVKTDPDSAAAVSVIALPLKKVALHVWPQLMPAGLLVTVPPPGPECCTVNWYEVCVGVGAGLLGAELLLQPKKEHATKINKKIPKRDPYIFII